MRIRDRLGPALFATCVAAVIALVLLAAFVAGRSLSAGTPVTGDAEADCLAQAEAAGYAPEVCEPLAEGWVPARWCAALGVQPAYAWREADGTRVDVPAGAALLRELDAEGARGRTRERACRALVREREWRTHPRCPTEDSCEHDYADGRWWTWQVTP